MSTGQNILIEGEGNDCCTDYTQCHGIKTQRWTSTHTFLSSVRHGRNIHSAPLKQKDERPIRKYRSCK